MGEIIEFFMGSACSPSVRAGLAGSLFEGTKGSGENEFGMRCKSRVLGKGCASDGGTSLLNGRGCPRKIWQISVIGT